MQALQLAHAILQYLDSEEYLQVVRDIVDQIQDLANLHEDGECVKSPRLDVGPLPSISQLLEMYESLNEFSQPSQLGHDKIQACWEEYNSYRDGLDQTVKYLREILSFEAEDSDTAVVLDGFFFRDLSAGHFPAVATLCLFLLLFLTTLCCLIICWVRGYKHTARVFFQLCCHPLCRSQDQRNRDNRRTVNRPSTSDGEHVSLRAHRQAALEYHN